LHSRALISSILSDWPPDLLEQGSFFVRTVRRCVKSPEIGCDAHASRSACFRGVRALQPRGVFC
jgi:hypothetical protein